MKILWILSLVLAATATPLSIQKWAEFKVRLTTLLTTNNSRSFQLAHQKQYSSPGEEAKRLKIFTENLAKIEAHNVRYEKGEVTYSKAMNKFGDWTAEEFLAFVNSTRFQKPRLAKAPPKLHLNRRLAEDEVDWRPKGAVTEVGTEGDCGASWSFSAVSTHNLPDNNHSNLCPVGSSRGSTRDQNRSTGSSEFAKSARLFGRLRQRSLRGWLDPQRLRLHPRQRNHVGE
jgi:C1A family cysteine protease